MLTKDERRAGRVAAGQGAGLHLGLAQGSLVAIQPPAAADHHPPSPGTASRHSRIDTHRIVVFLCHVAPRE
jgi:hypothetical protein